MHRGLLNMGRGASWKPHQRRAISTSWSAICSSWRRQWTADKQSRICGAVRTGPDKLAPQRILRHSSISVTTGTYVDVIEQIQRSAVAGMDSLLNSAQ
jgi:hypothetical protein